MLLNTLWSVSAFMVASGSGATQPVDLLASMDLWERQGGSDASFAIEGDHLRLWRGENEPSSLLTRADYENFELSFEYRIEQWGESGLFIHAPRNGAFRAGLELELADHHGSGPSPFVAGALYRLVPPKVVAVHPWEEWNRVKVLVDDPRIQVHINDQLVQEVDLTTDRELRARLRRGAIGFQNLGWKVDIRNLKLTELPDEEKAVSLFNGRDLTGWSVAAGNVRWTVRNGILVGEDGDGYLSHEMLVEDFDLRMYVRTGPVANGGVYFRWIGSEPFHARGHEIQILDPPGAVVTTGSIYGVVRGEDYMLTPGEWELLQVSVRGRHARTWVNGFGCAETDGLHYVRPGHIVLQMHRDKTAIELKDILLTPVPASR